MVADDSQPEPTPTKRPGGPPPRPYLVWVSHRFIVLTLLSSILAAFAVGRTARILLLDKPQRALLEYQKMLSLDRETYDQDREQQQQHHLPTPVLPVGKRLPRTSYTSKNFNTALGSSTDSRWVLAKVGNPSAAGAGSGSCKAGGGTGSCKDVSVLESEEDGEDEDDEEHQPAGQHLLIDIQYVDSHFLNSQERLANAMLQLINQCGLTLLSYHCHQLEPMGVTCVGVLLESHVSFHTWPADGVITLDLFTCGPNSLLPVVSVAETLFAIPQIKSDDDTTTTSTTWKKPKIIWAHKLRGFRDNVADGGYVEDADLMSIGMVSKRNDYKKEIVSVDTPFQTVDIWDVMKPHIHSLEAYEKSLSGDGSYESRNAKFFRPDRLVFLDGVLQSGRAGDAGYHEGLVHPALFAHENPKRVAIIGGGEGATLREVLKHNTIETVVMIEIDELMVKVSKEHLPEWNDCSNLIGSRPSCLDDPRAELYYADAFAWFTDRFLNTDSGLHAEPFDVIIMDALDPQIEKDFLDGLYDEGPFLRSLPLALTENGIFVAQVGEAPIFTTPTEVYSNNRNRVALVNSLVNIGFKSVREYELTHSGFYEAWQLLLVSKSHSTRARWFANEATITTEIQKRSMPTVDGESPFLYFDGATMTSFRYPTKNVETVYCRRDPLPESCKGGHGYDVERQNIPATSLEVKPSSSHDGLGVFAKSDIPEHSYTGLEKLVHSLYVAPATYNLALRSDRFRANVVKQYLHEYGSPITAGNGDILELSSEASIHFFVNQGCKGTNNVGRPLSVTETELLLGKETVHSPILARQVHFYDRGFPRRNIAPGEEFFENVLGRYGNAPEGWRDRVASLQNQCTLSE